LLSIVFARGWMPSPRRAAAAAPRAASDLTELAGLSVHVRSLPLSSVLSPRFLRR